MTEERLNHYLDLQGRVTRWPAPRKHKADQDLILSYLASKFNPEQVYTEREINDILRQYHTFDDWALLRRELFERGYINREKDGATYWLTDQTKIY